MGDLGTTNIGLMAEYFYYRFYNDEQGKGKGGSSKESDEQGKGKDGKKKSITQTDATVPIHHTQHGFMRFDGMKDKDVTLEGFLHIFNPALSKKSKQWQKNLEQWQKNPEQQEKPRLKEKPYYLKCLNLEIIPFGDIPVDYMPFEDYAGTECKANANHSETCFLDLIINGQVPPATRYEIFTNSSPCCEINNNADSGGTLGEKGCTEAIIDFCRKNKGKQVDVFFYRYYLPQDKSNAGGKLQDAEKEYKDYLKKIHGQQALPENFRLFKINGEKRQGEKKWVSRRQVESEQIEEILLPFPQDVAAGMDIDQDEAAGMDID